MLKPTANNTAETCISSILYFNGFKRGRDYTLSKGQLYLKNTNLKSKVVAVLNNFCPDKHYYWETPHLLRWF